MLAGPSAIEFPYQPPEEYDFRVTFTRTDGNDCLVQHGVGAGNPFVWILGGWGGRTCGLGPPTGVRTATRRLARCRPTS